MKPYVGQKISEPRRHGTKIEGDQGENGGLGSSLLTANARNIPPHNLEANEVDMAYPLDRIILKGEWD